MGQLTTEQQRAPAVEDVVATTLRYKNLRALRALLVGGYLGGVLILVGALLFVPSNHGNRGMVVLAVVELAAAAILAFWPDLPDPAIRFFGFTGAVLAIGAACALVDPLGPTPLFYLWPALNTGYYGNRRDVRLTSLVMLVTFGVSLHFAHQVQVPVITYCTVSMVFLSIVGVFHAFSLRTDEFVDQLTRAATTDPLTGLLNRRAFGHALEREVERARESGLPLSLIVFDLDHFKRINDGYGHPVGDEALVAFAGMLGTGCSITDVVARLGGEEFALLLFGTPALEAQQRVSRIAVELGLWAAQRSLPLTTSAGVASFEPAVDSPQELVKAADRALYAAKEAGRNRVLVAGAGRAELLLSAA